MKPRHDARLTIAALLAYACAGLAVGEVVDPLTQRLVLTCGAVVAAVGIVVCLAAMRRGSRWPMRCGELSAHIAVAGMVAVVATASAWVHMEARWDGGFRAAVAPESIVQVAGAVEREPVPLSASGFDGSPRVRVELSVFAWRLDESAADQESAVTWNPAGAMVVAIGGEELAGLAYGDRIVVTTPLTRLHGERAVGLAWDVVPDAWAPGDRLPGAVAAIREDFRDATSGLSVRVSGLTRGMVIGDTRSMPAPQRDAMQLAGLTHLTAVSGAHFAVVAVVMHMMLRQMRLHRGIRACVAGVGMIGFALLVFPDASVVRALVMALVGALAVWWGRPPQALAALATAVIVLVVADPFVTLEPGFALSVAAVAAIVLWAPRLRTILGRFVPQTLAMLVSVPLAAQAVCAPLLILFEPRVSVYAVVANLLAAPLAAPVTVIGLVGVVLGPISLDAATAAVWLASVFVWPVDVIARVTQALPGAAVAWPPGLHGATLLAALTCVAMWWTVNRGSIHLKVIVTAGLLVAVAVSARANQTWNWASPAPRQWSVVACDVGQGDMMLVRVDAHAAVIIDAGPGDETTSACMRRYGVTRVPLLVLTHPHADHDAGVPEVLANAVVEQVWMPQVALQPGLDRAASALNAAEVPIEVPSAGAQWSESDTFLRVLQAREVPAATMGPDVDGTVLNDSSLVLAASTRGVSLLAMGDLELESQRALATTLPDRVEVDVVKVPHHGSRVQDGGLAARIAAAVAVVSVGADNNYGHPTDVALELYRRAGNIVLRTDTCADIVVWREPELTVASDCR